MIVGRASQHRASIVGKTLRGMTDICLTFLPAVSPELSTVDECWRQSKKDLLKVLYVALGRLRQTND